MKRLLSVIITILLISSLGILNASEAVSGISDLKLKGTLFTNSLQPLAIVENARSGQIMMYEIGEAIDGLRIIDISRGEITIGREGGNYKLSFPQGAILQPLTDNSSKDKWYNIFKDGDTIVTDKATIKGAIYRIGSIMKNVKIKPAFVDGKKSGVMVTSLKEIGSLAEIGVKKGDIIKTVNGLKLNSPYQIFNAYRKLRNGEEFKVDVIRNNKPLVLTYRVENKI